MSTRKPIKEILSENKLSIALLGVIIVGASVGGYFIWDYMQTTENPNNITLATTTSTYDSGLLDYLLPYFTAETGITVNILSKGTGVAIDLAKRGDADVILVHSRSREDAFVNYSGGQVPYGVYRACVMYNDFIIVGFNYNPANLTDGDDIVTVMTKLYEGMNAGNTTFYSRGDDSGTHSKEKALWANAGYSYTNDILTLPEDIYVNCSGGMAKTAADLYEDQTDTGYTLIDRGTWLAVKGEYTELEILAEKEGSEDILLNPYGIIPVNPGLHPHVKFGAACRFAAFLTSPWGQDLIANFTIGGEVLFNPAFGICDTTHNCATTAEEVTFWEPFHSEFYGL